MTQQGRTGCANQRGLINANRTVKTDHSLLNLPPERQADPASMDQGTTNAGERHAKAVTVGSGFLARPRDRAVRGRRAGTCTVCTCDSCTPPLATLWLQSAVSGFISLAVVNGCTAGAADYQSVSSAASRRAGPRPRRNFRATHPSPQAQVCRVWRVCPYPYLLNLRAQVSTRGYKQALQILRPARVMVLPLRPSMRLLRAVRRRRRIAAC